MAFYLSRKDGNTDTYLYWWNETGSAWGPDSAKAHLFANPAKALDLAVLCGGPENAGQITVGETACTIEPGDLEAVKAARKRRRSRRGTV